MKPNNQIKSLVLTSVCCFSFFSCKEEIFLKNGKFLLKNEDLSGGRLINRPTKEIQNTLDKITKLDSFLVEINKFNQNENTNKIIKGTRGQLLDLTVQLGDLLREGIEETKKILNFKKGEINNNTTNILVYDSTSKNHLPLPNSSLNLGASQAPVKILGTIKEKLIEIENQMTLNLLQMTINELISLNDKKSSIINASNLHLADEPLIKAIRGKIEHYILIIKERLENTFRKNKALPNLEEFNQIINKFQEETRLTREGMKKWYGEKYDKTSTKSYEDLGLLIKRLPKYKSKIEDILSQYKVMVKNSQNKHLRKIEL